MIRIAGSFRLPPANMAAARPAMARVIAATRAEAGCIEYAYAEDVVDPGLIRVSEAWDSAEALAAHLAAPHMATWKTERESLGLSDRSLTRFGVVDEQPI